MTKVNRNSHLLIMVAIAAAISVSKPASAASEQKIAAVMHAREELNNSTARDERLFASRKIAVTARDLMVSNGYTCGEVKADESEMYSFAILSAPPGTRFASALAELQQMGVGVIAGGTDSAGFYMQEAKTIVISPFHALLGKDIISTTVVHEKLHAKLTHALEQSRSSLVDAEIRTPLDQAGRRSSGSITNIGGYTEYLSFQELFTFSDDIEMLSQGFPALETVTTKKPIQKIIDQKKTDLKAIANVIVDVTSKILATVDLLPDLRRQISVDQKMASILRVDIPFRSSTGNDAVFTMWLPELNGRQASSVSDSEIMHLTKSKIGDMQVNAKNFR